MKQSRQIILAGASILLIASFVVMKLQKTSTEMTADFPIGQTTEILENAATVDKTINILVPDDYEKYREKMTKFVQEGGDDPLPNTTFITKQTQLLVTGKVDYEKTSAQLAAAEFPTGGGPEKVSVEYFSLQNKTAYVVLNIDIDGWAGVSVAQAIIHPVVEKSLLQYTNTIEKVVFGYAPGDQPN